MASSRRFSSHPVGYSADKALASRRKSWPRSCSAFRSARSALVRQRICSMVQPFASNSTTNSTAMRVPLMTGLPTSTLGFTTIRSCQSMDSPLRDQDVFGVHLGIGDDDPEVLVAIGAQEGWFRALPLSDRIILSALGVV